MNTLTESTEQALPASILTKSQYKTFGPRPVSGYGAGAAIYALVRYDDECGNGHNTFSITGTIKAPRPRDHKGYWDNNVCGGCIHEEIAKAFPELAPLIKWHLVSSDGPMHYIGNTIYHAGDRDCWGLRKGEFRQHASGGKQNGGVEGVPNWVLEIPDREARDVYADQKPEPVVCEWKPYGRIGEGKERELDAARHSAVWPEATDEQLSAPPEELKRALMDRLPALMAEFKGAMEGLGFTY